METIVPSNFCSEMHMFKFVSVPELYIASSSATVDGAELSSSSSSEFIVGISEGDDGASFVVE